MKFMYAISSLQITSSSTFSLLSLFSSPPNNSIKYFFRSNFSFSWLTLFLLSSLSIFTTFHTFSVLLFSASYSFYFRFLYYVTHYILFSFSCILLYFILTSFSFSLHSLSQLHLFPSSLNSSLTVSSTFFSISLFPPLWSPFPFS